MDNLGVFSLYRPGEVVVCKTPGDKEEDTTVVGKMLVPTPEDPEEALQTLVIWTWLPIPNPVGVEELTVVALGQVLRSLGSVADIVRLLFQV